MKLDTSMSIGINYIISKSTYGRFMPLAPYCNLILLLIDGTCVYAELVTGVIVYRKVLNITDTLI